MVAIDNVVTVRDTTFLLAPPPPPQKSQDQQRLHKIVKDFRKSSVTSIDYHNGSYSGSMVMVLLGSAALFSLPSTSRKERSFLCSLYENTRLKIILYVSSLNC